MTISLATDYTKDGLRCTYSDSGEYAGIIKPIMYDFCVVGWLAEPVNDGRPTRFKDVEAAKYYVLAHAIEARA